MRAAAPAALLAALAAAAPAQDAVGNACGALTLALAVEEGAPLGPARLAPLALGLDGPSELSDVWPFLAGVVLRLGWEPLPPEGG